MRLFLVFLQLFIFINGFSQGGASTTQIDPKNWKACASNKIISPLTYTKVGKGHHKIDSLKGIMKYQVTECQTIQNIDIMRTYWVEETKTYTKGLELIAEQKTYKKFRYHYDDPKTKNIGELTDLNLSDNFQSLTQFDNQSSFSTHRMIDTIQLDRPTLRKIYREGDRRKHHFFASLNLIPSITYRALYVNSSTYNVADELQKRQLSEKSDYRWSSSITIGYSYKKRHYIYLEGLYLQQGFLSRHNKVNWNTSFADEPTNAVQHYKFNYGCVGVGYTYKGTSNTTHALFDLGLLYSFYQFANYSVNSTSVYSKDLNTSEATKNLIFNQLTAKAGMGIAVTLGRCAELRFVPTFYYNLSPSNSEYIATRLFNVGLSTGVVFYFAKME